MSYRISDIANRYGWKIPKVEIKLSEIASQFAGELNGEDRIITGLASLETAETGDLTFLVMGKYAALAAQSKASGLLVSAKDDTAWHIPVVKVKDPGAVFTALCIRFYPNLTRPQGIHETAVIGNGVKLGENVALGPYSVVGDDAVIGDNTVLFAHAVIGREVVIGNDCMIHAHVSIRDRSVIGNRVTIKDGAVIGSDGFSNTPDREGHWHPNPQIGIVVIEDDVSIGANTCIDRPLIDATVIECGAKLDNLIHIGHSVQIGAHTAMAAQVGVAGSTRIGKHCVVAGQAGFNSHIHVGDGVVIAGQTGVIGDVEGGRKVLWGTPAMPHRTKLRIDALHGELQTLFRRVEEIEKQLQDRMQ